MRRLRLLLLCFLALPSVALADDKHASAPSGAGYVTDLSAVACSASAATRTFTLTSGTGAGFGLIAMQLDFTRTSGTGITLTFTCSVSANKQTSWAQLYACDSTTDGVCSLNAATVVASPGSASLNVPVRLDFLGYPDAKCVIECGGSSPVGTFSVYRRLSTL